jgi:hypothetical protein
VSVHFEAARNRWVVRWREDGRHRHVRRGDGNAARALDAQGDTLTITLGAGA